MLSSIGCVAAAPSLPTTLATSLANSGSIPVTYPPCYRSGGRNSILSTVVIKCATLFGAARFGRVGSRRHRGEKWLIVASVSELTVHRADLRWVNPVAERRLIRTWAAAKVSSSVSVSPVWGPAQGSLLRWPSILT